MIEKEAIDILKNDTPDTSDAWHDALNMAIEALVHKEKLKEAYIKGYQDGMKAQAVHEELCREEQEG